MILLLMVSFSMYDPGARIVDGVNIWKVGSETCMTRFYKDEFWISPGIQSTCSSSIVISWCSVSKITLKDLHFSCHLSLKTNMIPALVWWWERWAWGLRLNLFLIYQAMKIIKTQYRQLNMIWTFYLREIMCGPAQNSLRIQIKIRRLIVNTYFGKQIKDSSNNIPLCFPPPVALWMLFNYF